ncbi:MAG: hypothetical protein AAF840_05475 [Bacteroidota bacterium]
MSAITTVTLFRYTSVRNKAWAFTQMGRMLDWPLANPLAGTAGLRFGRLMGSGANNGFGLRPNFGVYALLGHWEDRAAAEQFFASHPWLQQTQHRTCDLATFFLLPTMTHGEWGGQRPFIPNPDAYDPNLPVAVITRATIRTRKLLDFWRYVPSTSAAVYEHQERKLSIGVGEYPVFMQATFSLWTSGKAMQQFAYRSGLHKEVVRLTRERQWYKEEMFTRFTVLEAQGTWEGRPAANLC